MNIKKLSPQEIHAAKWFFNFFKKIPANQWCCGKLMTGDGRRCALGHLGVQANLNEKAIKLQNLIGRIDVINDSQRRIGSFQQKNTKMIKTPKRNILRAIARSIKSKSVF